MPPTLKDTAYQQYINGSIIQRNFQELIPDNIARRLKQTQQADILMLELFKHLQPYDSVRASVRLDANMNDLEKSNLVVNYVFYKNTVYCGVTVDVNFSNYTVTISPSGYGLESIPQIFNMADPDMLKNARKYIFRMVEGRDGT